MQNLEPLEKLVRHHSPEQLEAQGEKVTWRIADHSEMLSLLRAKIIEEVEELVEAIDAKSPHVIEELADVSEVVMALRACLGPFEVDEKIREKFFDRGSFMRGVVMTIVPAVPMILHCPKCGEKHVDRGIFGTTHVHRTHLCHACGETWKPFDYATVGVEDVAVYKLAGSGNVIGGAFRPLDAQEEEALRNFDPNHPQETHDIISLVNEILGCRRGGE